MRTNPVHRVVVEWTFGLAEFDPSTLFPWVQNRLPICLTYTPSQTNGRHPNPYFEGTGSR